ncbi:hypothetical protein F4604DRAFT_1939552 [Suillus subluteus]|nr:hypothetical protein F4604DRAFT_1939552 [Suillus subluteus]
MPTIGPIRNEQFDHNIQTVVLDTRSDLLPLRGVSFMIDEIALEEMAVHFRKFNKVGGLCWKHSHVIDPVLRTYDSAISIAQKIHDGHVHLGKELTVIGLSCFGEDEIYPILAAPTCKTEDSLRHGAHPCANLSNTGTQVVQLHPSDLLGLLRRMVMPLDMLPDTNFSLRHLYFQTHLLWLPAYEEAAVTKLLYPDDPQDVPRAVELMLAIIEFSNSQLHITNDSFSLDINTCADVASIYLLSKLLESILMPFIHVDLSLSQQFEHLSLRHSFMSYQLYYDTQTMTKNAIFCLAKQQSLDPYAPFFLGDVGDDPLKILFGHTRMISGHNSACSYAQALDRLAAAKDIDGVFKHHPKLDPEVWEGDIVSGRCDLPLLWHKGRNDALLILTTSQLDLAHYSYAELFTATSGIDMLLSCPDLPLPLQQSPTSQCLLETVLSEDGVEGAGPRELQGENDDEEIMLTFQEALIDDSPTDAPPAQSNQPHTLDPLSPPLPQGPGILS